MLAVDLVTVLAVELALIVSVAFVLRYYGVIPRGPRPVSRSSRGEAGRCPSRQPMNGLTSGKPVAECTF